MTKRGSWVMGAVLAGLAICAAPAQAGVERIVNGSFETGNFSGWTQTGNTTFNGVQCPGPGPTVSTGNCSAFFGPVGSTGGISQIVDLGVTGTSWHLIFDFLPDGGNPSSFSVLLAGQTLYSVTNPAASGFQHFHFGGTTLATGQGNQTLAFNFRDDPGFLFLDGVSLVVPEPATLALLGAALAGLGFSRRRKAA